MRRQPPASHVDNARRDLLTGCIVIASSLLFIWTGGRAVSQAVQGLIGLGAGVEQILMTAVLLNVALILFGYRRYRDLQAEIRQRTEAEERARSLAATDPLTGFLNRRAFGEEGDMALEQARAGDWSVAVLALDLDHFKTVNDIHGHAAGDHLLKQVAERIRAALPADAITSRQGGDEFACILPFSPSRRQMVDESAARLIREIVAPVEHGGVQLGVSASIGIARSDRDGNSFEQLLRRADIAMYVAKQQGRQRFAWFAPSMEDDINTRTALEANMRRGIPAGEFIPYYEQQVDLMTGRLLGFEMLARWHNAELGEVMPETFIPVAEETGMIDDLSMSLMRQAFEQARDWSADLTLSVNISPVQLRDPWLSQKILKLLTETGFPAARLEVEITESALFENLSLAQSIVTSLKHQGIRIALDDFGTGYSSLAHLRALPFDRIKIDRSFVTTMADNPESATIVQAIARLAENLGLPVTAEGIETSDIERELRALGLRKGQGWHFGQPMTLEEAQTFLDKRALAAPSGEGGGKSLPYSAPRAVRPVTQPR